MINWRQNGSNCDSEQGNTQASMNLSFLHLTGLGVERDLDHAKRLLREAANAGDERAQLAYETLNQQRIVERYNSVRGKLSFEEFRQLMGASLEVDAYFGQYQDQIYRREYNREMFNNDRR